MSFWAATGAQFRKFPKVSIYSQTCKCHGKGRNTNGRKSSPQNETSIVSELLFNPTHSFNTIFFKNLCLFLRI